MNRRRRTIATIAVAGMVLLAIMWNRRDSATHTVNRGMVLMGTLFEFTAVGRNEAQLDEWIDAAIAEVRRVENVASDYDSTAGLARLNSNVAGTLSVSRELAALLARSIAVAERTNGAFDPATGAATMHWRRSERANTYPSRTVTDSLARQIARSHVAVDTAESVVYKSADTILDLGAIAKGYAVDRAIAMLDGFSISGALVNGGGDVAARGAAPGGRLWRIGIRHPREGATSYLGIIEISDGAIATSGDYERGYEFDGVMYHHILDPETARPAVRSVSATVVAPTAEQADALATAVFVLGPRAGVQLLNGIADVEGLIVSERNGELRCVASRNMMDHTWIDTTKVRIDTVSGG